MPNLLTHERLREELRSFARGALRIELKEMGDRLVREVAEELRDVRPLSPVSAVSIVRTPADGGTTVKLQSKSGSPQPTGDLVGGITSRTPTAEMMHLVRTIGKPDSVSRRSSNESEKEMDPSFDADDDFGIMKSLRSYKVTDNMAEIPVKRRQSDLVLSSPVKTLQTPASPVTQLMRGWSTSSAGTPRSLPKGSPAATSSTSGSTKRANKLLAPSERALRICTDESSEHSECEPDTPGCRRKVRSSSDSAKLPEGMVLDAALCSSRVEVKPPAEGPEVEPPLPMSVPLSPRIKRANPKEAKDADCVELPPPVFSGIVPAAPPQKFMWTGGESDDGSSMATSEDTRAKAGQCKNGTLDKGDSFVSSGREPFGTQMDQLYFQRDQRRKNTNMSLGGDVYPVKNLSFRPSNGERMTLFSYLEAIIDNSYFNHFMALVIVANLVAVGMQTDYLATMVTESTPVGYTVAEALFCTVFLVELLLRIYVHRCAFFTSVGWQWNVFDCAMVLLQVSEQILELVIRSLGDGAGSSFSFGFLRALRILRVIRLLRAARIVEHVQELQTIVLSIGGSIKSLLWTLLLLALLIFVVGVSFTQIVLNYRLSNTGISPESVFVAHYGSLGASVLTLYGSIMGGVDWVGVAEPLLTEIHPLCGIVFAFYVAFAVLAMMNVVTGVFVESSLKTARDHHEAFLLSHAGNLFVDADLDDSGSVSWSEFQSSLDHPQMIQFFKSIDVDITEAETVFHLLDFNECGKIELDQFMGGVLRLRGPAKAVDLAMLMHETRRMARRQGKQMSCLYRKLGDLTKLLSAIDTVEPSSKEHLVARKRSSEMTMEPHTAM